MLRLTFLELVEAIPSRMETAAAVGCTTLSFAIAPLLAAPVMAFQYLGLRSDGDIELSWSWIFSVALFLIATACLMRYVFQPMTLTQDKPFDVEKQRGDAAETHSR